VFSAKTLRQGPFADCVDNCPTGLLVTGSWPLIDGCCLQFQPLDTVLIT
jgi:hypothetical protein